MKTADQSFYKADLNLINKLNPQPNNTKSSSIEILSLNSFFVLEVIVSLVFVGLVYARS